MKKISNLILISMLAMGIASCSNDSVLEEGNNPNLNNGNTLTFTIPVKGGVTTYATQGANEGYKDQAISVYMFGASGLEHIFGSSDIAVSGSGASATATIQLDPSWSSTKTFYMVADNGSATTALSAVTTGDTEANFIKIVTESQGATQLATPLLLTGKTTVDVSSATTANITLRRSVARFDIDNNVTANGVEINSVLIENANLQGYVFGYEQKPAIMASPATGSFSAIAVAAPVTGMQAQEALFYLYPTVMGANGSGTQIKLAATVGGQVKNYVLKNAAGTDITIEANKRYKIKAVATPNGLEFTVTVSDWDDADEDLIGEPATTRIEDLVSDAAILAYLDTKYGISGEVTQDQLNSVTEIKSINIASLTGLKNFPNLKTLDCLKPFTGDEIDLSDLPIGITSMNLFGADAAISSIKNTNNVVLQDLKAIYLQETKLTAINLASAAPNLTTFSCYNSKLVESVTLNTNIEKLNLKYTSISTFDPSVYPNLIDLGIDGTSIASIDISNNPKLTDLWAYDTQLSNVKFNSVVKVFGNRGNKVLPANLDLSIAPTLEIIVLQGANILTLDISTCKNLKTLHINECPNLTTVTVWSGFDPTSLTQYRDADSPNLTLVGQ